MKTTAGNRRRRHRSSPGNALLRPTPNKEDEACTRVQPAPLEWQQRIVMMIVGLLLFLLSTWNRRLLTGGPFFDQHRLVVCTALVLALE